MTRGRPIRRNDLFLPNIVATRGREMYGTLQATGWTRHDTRFRSKTGRLWTKAIRVGYANWYIPPTSGEMGNQNAITLSAGLETIGVLDAPYGQGSPTITLPHTFSGVLNPNLIGNAPVVWSDMLAVDLPPGSLLYHRTSVLVAANEYIPYSHDVSGNNEGSIVSSGASQAYATGALDTAGSSPTSGGKGYGPYAIAGVTVGWEPSAILCGDSITEGSADGSTGDGQGNFGLFERGLWDVDGYPVPFVNLSRSGEWAPGNQMTVGGRIASAFRRQLWDEVTDIIVALGTNDISLGRPLAAIQSDLGDIYAAAKRRGLRVTASKILPRVTGTYSTVEGQTPVAGFEVGGIRDQVNAWIDTQIGTLVDYVIDPNAYLESPSAPGRWVPDVTSDGVHPNSSGCALGAPAVTAVAGQWLERGW